MAVRPRYIYKMNDDNVILSSVPASGDVTVYKSEQLLLVYDAYDIAYYGIGKKIRITTTAVSVPSGTYSLYSTFYNRYATSSITIGQKFTYNSSIQCSYGSYDSRSGQHYYDGILSPIRSVNGYVYVTYSASAVNSGGSVLDYETITLSGFDLTYEAYSTYPFTVTSSFSGGYKSPSKPFTVDLSATYYSDAITQYKIASGTLYYKKSGASSYQQIPFTGQSVTVPAGTLESNTSYDVYLTATATNSASATSSHATVSTVDGTAVVAPVSPNNEVTHGDITFTWNFSNTTGESQYAYDIQTSTDNSTWTTILSHVVSSQTSATYTQTHAGDTYWRVRGYNQNDVAGSWSASAHYVNNVPPQPPVILEVIAGGRVHVRWSAENQISYHIQVVQNGNGHIVYDSGDVYGTESLALVNTYLPNGTYTIKVKISNIYGNESEWSTIQFQQSTELPTLDYSVNYVAQSNGVVITVNSEGFDKYYLVRNGELIAEFTENSYIDMFASGETNYRLIAVTSEDLFAQAIFTINAAVPSARLITQGGQVLTVSERWDNFNNAEQSEEVRYSANEYLGASAPEHLFSKMRVKRFTRAFYDPNRIARQLLGTVAFYADEYGNGDWVAITSYTRADSWLGDDTKIEMEVTTRKENVTYAV